MFSIKREIDKENKVLTFGPATALFIFLLFSCSPVIVKPEPKSKLDQRRIEFCEKKIDIARCRKIALKRTREIVGYEPSEHTLSEKGSFNCKLYALQKLRENNDRREYKEAYRYCQDIFNKELASCPQEQFDQCMKNTQRFW